MYTVMLCPCASPLPPAPKHMSTDIFRLSQSQFHPFLIHELSPGSNKSNTTGIVAESTYPPFVVVFVLLIS